MAEWWESSSNIRGIAKVMADEFKKAGVCDSGGSGGSGSSNSETPQDQFNDAQNEATERLGIFGTVISSLTNPLKKLRDVVDAAFGDVIRRAAYDFEAAMYSSIEANKTWRTQMYAMRLGDTAANIAKLSSETRQSALAMGGMETWFNRINDAQAEYFGFIGDTGDTTRYLAKQMQMFGEYGIKPSMAAMHDITKISGGTSKSLKDITVGLAKMGIPVTEQQEMLQDILSDENVQAKLRAVNSSKERTAIVRNLMARQEEYRALGMTKEQALAAGKALEAMAGKKPMDRYKQAAKATAALSGMGIEGAAMVGEIIRKGQRATKEEKEYARERLAMAEDIYAESKLMGRGYEFTIATLMEKGGLADMLGEGGLFSTKIRETISIQEELIKSMKVLGERNTTEADVVVGSMHTIQEMNNALSNTIPGLLLQKGPIGVGVLAGLEGLFTAMGDSGLIDQKEKDEFMGMVGAVKDFTGDSEKRNDMLSNIMDKMKSKRDEAMANLGLGNIGELIMNNPVVGKVGELVSGVKNWYKDWKTDVFGSEEEQREDKIVELTEQNNASMEKLVKFADQQTKTFSQLTQHSMDAEAKKLAAGQQQLDALVDIKKNTITAPNALKGEAVGVN